VRTCRRDFIVSGLYAAAGLTTGCALTGRGVRTVRLLHLGDPQFGFCPPVDSNESYVSCRERFERLTEMANGMRPDLVFISGDMCNRRTDLGREWPELIRRFEVPVFVTPGNHDLGQEITAESLSAFRRVFGYDRTALSIGGWYFIFGNSQFWRPTALADEQAEYERWVRERLEEAKTYGGHIVLGTHVPPFVVSPEEADSYENYPLKGRKERLALYDEAGARFYLAGHTHRHFVRATHTLRILNPETTSWNFDNRPYGGRLLTLRPDFTYDYEFVSVS